MRLCLVVFIPKSFRCAPVIGPVHTTGGTQITAIGKNFRMMERGCLSGHTLIFL